jgi:Na+/H+-dicarboxylate symporter
MSSLRIALGLLAGLIGGLLLHGMPGALSDWLWMILEPVGTLWLNALRMTVLPLVVALLVAGIGRSTETAGASRLALRSLRVFVVLLAVGAVLGAALSVGFLALWPVAPEAAAALRAAASSASAVPQLPPLRDWLVTVIPANPFEAAATGAVLPLVVFAVLLGLAAGRIETARRQLLLGFFEALSDALFKLVHGVLWAAPLGVFALALGVGRNGGLAVAGAIGQYLVLASGLSVVLTLLLYPVAVYGGGVGWRQFARAAAPAQVVAISTQSSLASLPAMLTGMAGLQPARPDAAVVLPLAVSLFRMTSPLVNIGIVLFVAHVHGVAIGPGAMLAGLLLAVVTSWSVVGLASQVTFFNTTVPMSLAMGVPTGVLPLLLAVEVIPDLFRTVGNVTADLAAAAWITRRAATPPERAL